MNSKDLRIGNYVHGKHYDFRKVVKLDERDGHDNVYVDNYGYVQGGFIKPIPLTEEWLKRFGVIDYNYLYLNDEIGAIYYDKSDDCFYIYSGMGDPSSYGFKIKCEHVHQLQNLYHALTGQELEIKPLQP